eukprot:Gb_25205 [translate_table: standard]
MDEQAEKKLHFLLFPWLAHGHIFLYMQLSKRLLARDVLEIELPLVQGLPCGQDSTALLSPDKVPLLKTALDLLEKPFEVLLQRISPDCVVHDFAQCWAPPVASKFHIPTVTFMIFGAAATAKFVLHGQGGNAPDYFFRPFSPAPSSSNKQADTGISAIERTIKCIEGCSALAVKSCLELENKFVGYLGQLTGKPVLCMGPLLPAPPKVEARPDCLRWLDGQRRSSVVFVSFGTECFLSEEQIQELALGLEGSQQPFLWALRFLPGSCGGISFLPDGFESRIQQRGQGLVCSWVPQIEILSHPSTGGFLTHCGWSSLMEGISLGLPLIALPMGADQPINARLVAEEWKVGVQVEKGNNGSFKREEIVRALKLAMLEEEGLELRKKAKETGDEIQSKVLSSGGSQERYVDEFVDMIKDLAAAKKRVPHSSLIQQQQEESRKEG